MIRSQVRAEWIKLATVRSTWVILTLVVLVEIVLRVVGVLVAASDAGPRGVLLSLRPSIVFPTAIAVLPALLATSEWRYGTVVTTYALQPIRRRVLAAKVAVSVLSGGVAALLLGASATAAALVALSARSLPHPSAAELALLLGSGIVSGGTLGPTAVALGYLLREQGTTITAAVAILFVLPLPIALLSPRAYTWTPSGLVDAAAGLGTADPTITDPVAAMLSLCLLATAAATLAAIDQRRRDLP